MPPARRRRGRRCRVVVVMPATPIVATRPRMAGPALPIRPSALPEAPLVIVPHAAVPVSVEHKDARARIIEVAVPPDGFVVAAVSISVTGVRITVAVGAVPAISVAVAVHVIGAACERYASYQRDSSKL